jgi:hypothetical protein
MIQGNDVFGDRMHCGKPSELDLSRNVSVLA